ncbi:MAG: complement resistance protein TraT [Rhodospirillaceae bacterium]
MGRIKTGRLVVALAAVSWLGGCAAADVAINHSSLQVQTHMSESIFLEPVPERARTIYIGARNTSDHPEIDLRGPLAQAVAARGYRVVSDPGAAHYMLRVNILQAGPIDPKNKMGVLAAKYGEPLLAGAGAAGLTRLFGGDTATTTGVGLGIALGTYLANSMIKDVTYSVITDIQLSERPLGGGKVRQTSSTSSSSSHSASERLDSSGPELSSSSQSSRSKTQYVEESPDFKQYQIRCTTYADQMNLKFEEAVPMLVSKLTSSLSNLFD